MVTRFKQIKDHVRSFMQISENNYLLDLILASAISLALPNPVWMMLIGPPSSGKTELLKIIQKVPHFFSLGNITEKTLFSGHQNAGGGFIPREIGEAGIIALPDFTTIISRRASVRDNIFNHLRIAYDGEVTTASGLDIGPGIAWKGKIALIGCVTDSIERYKNESSDLGERFLFYRFVPTSPTIKEIDAAQRNSNKDHKPFYLDVARFVTQKQALVHKVRISSRERRPLIKFANIIAQGRAAVVRDGLSRNITLVHPPEQIWRLLRAFENLHRCLIVLHDGDVRMSLKILEQVCTSTLPQLRLKVIQALAPHTELVSINHLEKATGYPTTTLKHILTDMIAQNMVANRFSLTTDFKYLWNSARI